MKRKSIILCCLLLLSWGSMQAQSEFNPDPPADPQVPVFYYPLTISCNPESAGYKSGAGNYAPGTVVTVSTSPNAGYVFNHWELNGARYDAATTTSFSYTAVAGRMDFVAVYDFVPNDPSDPTMNVKSRLYLTSEPAGVCTFNRTSGAFVEADQYVSVDVTGVDQLYEFAGWYLGGVKLTDEQAFNHMMGYHDETLVAHFNQLTFNPANPGDPLTVEGQTNIQTHETGDVNKDGVIDVTDAVAVINVYLTGNSSTVNTGLSDVNKDGVIDVTDAVAIINYYLTHK